MLVIGSKDYINNNLQLLIKDKEIIFNDYGKPYINNSKVFFNKSYTKDLSVLLIESKECGVDIEKKRVFNESMAKKFCSIEELNFLRDTNNKDYYFTLFWILKEAYLKCIGIGITIKMKSISFIKNKELYLKIDKYNFTIWEWDEYLIAGCKEVTY